jgi:raffinose/stachyose/melibiose transport system permease protein
MERNKAKDRIIPLLLLLPALLIYFAFIVYPVFSTVQLSFFSWRGIYGAPKTFVGWDNFVRVLNDGSFWNSMLNSVYFLIGGFVILMPLSFGLALLITSKLKFTRLMKTAYFMPVMLSTTAVALMWVYLLNPTYGLVNGVLRLLGLSSWCREWLSTPTLNVWCVVLVNEWMYAGYNMLIFASGLVGIPSDLYEAAAIDGCTGWKKVFYITIPLCKDSFKVFSILCITGCLKTFDLIWAMTKGGPNRSSETPATLLYNEAFTFKAFGKSSAIGVILLVLGIALSLAVNHAFQKREEQR